MSTPGALLAIWEVAASASARERSIALLRAVGEDQTGSLGACNAALCKLRSMLLGPSQQLRCNCPDCGATCEFTIDCDQLALAALPASGSCDPQSISCSGYEVAFRLPCVVDIEAAASGGDDSFEEQLLNRCVTNVDAPHRRSVAVSKLPSAVLEAISRRMEELEPGASLEFDVTCPECACSWSAPMDVSDVLWTEVRAHAERLFLDIDALSQAYGWSEESILALSPARRAAYLQLVRAAT